jgi:hypothetical protein
MRPKLPLPTDHDRAVNAIRAMHAIRGAEWYPGGIRVSVPPNAYRDGGPVYPCFATDLDHDERAIRSWPERQPFGWIVYPCGTHMIRAGLIGRDHSMWRERCRYGAIIRDTFTPGPFGFYAWDGRALDALHTAEGFDTRITDLAAQWEAAQRTERAA